MVVVAHTRTSLRHGVIEADRVAEEFRERPPLWQAACIASNADEPFATVTDVLSIIPLWGRKLSSPETRLPNAAEQSTVTDTVISCDWLWL